MSTVHIQAEISGYQGPAVNLLGALDTDSGLLIVARTLPLGDRAPEALVSSNDPRTDGRDTLFDEDRLQDAIHNFFRAKSTGMVELLPAVNRYDPSNRIENNGIDEHGTKYRLHPDITNGDIAVLAMIDAAHRAYGTEAVADFASEMADLFMSI